MAFVIPSIFKAIDKFSPVVKGMSGTVDKFAERAERRLRKVSDTAMKIGTGAAIVGTAIAAPLIAAANSAVKFEEKMSNVATLIDTNKESMADMGANVLELAKRLPVPIEELTTSLYDIRSAGISAGEAMGVLEMSAQLGAAGLSTTSEATNIMTSAINAFKSEGLSAAEISDTLFKTVKAGKTTLSEVAQAFGATAPTVQAAGVRLAEFQAATAALTTVGTPAAQAQNQIRAAVVALQKPTADMTKIFEKLGVKSGPELIKKTGGLVPAMQAIESQGKSMGLNMAKAWSSVEAGGAVTSLTGATNAAYTATMDDMVNGSNAVNDAFKKQAETSKAQMQIMSNNIEALSISVGQVLLPVLNSLIQKIVPVIQKFGNWSKENPKLFKGLIIGAAVIAGIAFTISALSFTVAIASKGMMLFGMASKVVTAAQWLWAGALYAVTGAQWLWNAAMSANPIGLIIIGIAALIAIVVVIIKYWNEWGASVVAIFTYFMPAIGLIISLVMTFYNNWARIVAAFKEGGILEGLKAIGSTLLDVVLFPLQQILETIAKITGSDMAANAAKSIEAFRKDIGVTMAPSETEGATPAVNSEKNKQDALVQKMESTQNAKVDLNINDPNNRVQANTSNPKIINIRSTSTTGFGM